MPPTPSRTLAAHVARFGQHQPERIHSRGKCHDIARRTDSHNIRVIAEELDARPKPELCRQPLEIGLLGTVADYQQMNVACRTEQSERPDQDILAFAPDQRPDRGNHRGIVGDAELAPRVGARFPSEPGEVDPVVNHLCLVRFHAVVEERLDHLPRHPDHQRGLVQQESVSAAPQISDVEVRQQRHSRPRATGASHWQGPALLE